LTDDQANSLKVDADYAVKDLANHLDAGKTAEWDVFIQAIPEK